MTLRTVCFCFALHLLALVPAFPAVAAEATEESYPANPSAMVQRGNSIVPVVRRNPDYPRAALNNGLDGWVVLSLAIVPGGATENVIALSSSHPDFESFAIDAVSRWKYELPEEGPDAKGITIQTVIKFT